MESKPSIKNVANILGVISSTIAVVMILLILNWLFAITPYQKLEGFPLLMTMFTSPIGFVLGIISIKISSNKFGKIGIIGNVILFLLPYAYWFLGTLIFGP